MCNWGRKSVHRTVGFFEVEARRCRQPHYRARHPSYKKLLVPIICIRGHRHTCDVRLERRRQLYCVSEMIHMWVVTPDTDWGNFPMRNAYSVNQSSNRRVEISCYDCIQIKKKRLNWKCERTRLNWNSLNSYPVSALHKLHYKDSGSIALGPLSIN